MTARKRAERRGRKSYTRISSCLLIAMSVCTSPREGRGGADISSWGNKGKGKGGMYFALGWIGLGCIKNRSLVKAGKNGFYDTKMGIGMGENVKEGDGEGKERERQRAGHGERKGGEEEETERERKKK